MGSSCSVPAHEGKLKGSGGRGAPSTATTKASRPSNSVPTSLTLAAATARASSTHPTLLTLASKCDSSYIARLEANATDAASHASSSLSDITRAVSQSVAVAASNARHHTRYADKRLGMKEEELTDTIKAYVSCLQQLCSAGLEDVDFLEDSWESINRLLSNTVDFPSVSFVVALAPCDARQRMLESTRIQSSIDPLRCSPTHDPWLARGASNTVTISMLYDSFGDCVQRLAVEDVECAVNEDAVGWSVVPVSVRANMLTLEVSLLQDCTSTAVLTVHAGGVSVPCPLKALAGEAAETAARAVCSRVGAIEGVVSAEDVAALVEACAPTLASAVVAEEFLDTIWKLCKHGRDPVIKERCGAAGAVQAVVSAMLTHAATSVDVARKGCDALGNLAALSPSNTELIVLSAGGLGVIHVAMEAHPGDKSVQNKACFALNILALGASRSDVSPGVLIAMLEGRSVELIRTAKVNHPTEGVATVVYYADAALHALRVQE